MEHGFARKPMHLCLIKFGTGTNTRALPLPAQSGIALQIYAFVTPTYFKIAINSADGTPDPTGETWTFKYYIFVENGA
jgi:hypothetical protein